MSDVKKFLDYEGVRYLWSKINMNDYPNNETLMAVINAIDETKADKTDIVQSDWLQMDDTKFDYIKNKPQIATIEEIISLLFEEDLIASIADSDGSILTDENNNIITW